MTRTAYWSQLSPEEFEATYGECTPEEKEHARLENMFSPLFDMVIRFMQVAGDKAIDRLDVTEEDVKAYLTYMRKDGEPAGTLGKMFDATVESIIGRIATRRMSHMVSAIWEYERKAESISLSEVRERYDRIPKGES